MFGKHIKLIYFSLGDSEAKQISLGWKKIVGYCVLIFAVLLVTTFLTLEFFTDVYHDWKVAHLSKANYQLEEMLNEMGKKVQIIEGKVQLLEKEDDDLRVFVDLPSINKDVRKLGVGGHAPETYASYSILNENSANEAVQIKRLIDNLDQRIDLASKSYGEIITQHNKNLRTLKQTPSIRPLLGGRISDKFGIRLDPFVDQFRKHDGVDISAPRGTDVYATADGKVIEVVTKYRPNHGYGKQVRIDHGNGLITRYAHLQKVLVKPGERITRHTVIGKVGDTGRSTGPHLHYEVINNGTPVDPATYMID